MRKHSLLVASTLALVAASTLAPSLAHAACTEPDGRCGDGAGHGIKYAATQTVLSPAVGFNWESQPYNILGLADVRAVAQIGLAFAQLKDEVKGGYQPIWSVDLDKAPLVATWTGDSKIVTIKRNESTQETASLDIRYTVRPNAQIGLDWSTSTPPSWSQLFRYNFDATPLVSDVIGNPDFGIDGNGVKKFKPWALTALDPYLVTGGSIPANGVPGQNNSALFNRPWAFGDFANSSVAADGTFGVYVKTDPKFTYKTLSVKYAETELADDITIDLPEQAEYGNSIKVPVKVRGGVRIDGTVQARPFLHVNRIKMPIIGTQTINYTFETTIAPLVEDIAIPAAAGTFNEFDFPTTSEVVIPIPNVKIAQTAAEFVGTVGGEGSAKVTIRNEGDAPAKLKFEKEGDFQLNTQATDIPPGGTFDLLVRARPTVAGTVTGSVKVLSNDPDSPVVSFNVEGKFTDPVIDEEGTSSSSGGKSSSSGGNNADGDNTGDAAADDSGCGCKTAGTSATSSLGLFGSLALGLAAVIRRRRKN